MESKAPCQGVKRRLYYDTFTDADRFERQLDGGIMTQPLLL